VEEMKEGMSEELKEAYNQGISHGTQEAVQAQGTDFFFSKFPAVSAINLVSKLTRSDVEYVKGQKGSLEENLEIGWGAANYVYNFVSGGSEESPEGYDPDAEAPHVPTGGTRTDTPPKAQEPGGNPTLAFDSEE
jgi:hypothetical protein